MASSGQPLAYAPYHRRSQSTASTNSVGASRPAASVSAAPQPPASPAPKPEAAAPPPPPPSIAARPRPVAAAAAPAASSADAAPPPLRTAASIRAAQQKQKAPAVNASVPGKRVVSSPPVQEKVKEKGSSGEAAPSSSNVAPSAPSNGTSSPKQRPTSPPATSHARNPSVPSALAGVPAVPQHISTAVRLRTAGGGGGNATPSTSNSGASTPTARTQSPAFGGDNGAFGFGSGSSSALNGNGNGDALGPRQTPYRPGFQPKGVYRLRTDEFRAERAQKGRRKKRIDGEQGSAAVDDLEGQRMERRLEKLMALHFPPPGEEAAIDEAPSSTWRTLLQTTRAGRKAEEERRLREREMELVRWEADQERSGCAICSTSFSLAVRRHHCRLCGRLVCASPHLSLPAPTVDRSSVSDLKCSGLVDADKATGKLRDVPKLAPGVTERKGVRICRDCREVVVRRQYMMDPGHVPRYLKLYEELTKLQREIEQTLPEFQEMVLGLQKQDAAAALGTDEVDTSPTSRTAAKAALLLQRDAAAARKQLLLNFANYDQLAKRIRALEPEPDLDGPAAGAASTADSAQVRLQTAIWTRANLFLQQNMFPLQSLPTTKRAQGGHNRSASTASTSTAVAGEGEPPSPASPPSKHRNGGGGDASWASRFAGKGAVQGRTDDRLQSEADSEARQDPKGAREALQVLEQQLEQVQRFAADAGRARKLEDARTLKASAEELRLEVARRREALKRAAQK